MSSLHRTRWAAIGAAVAVTLGAGGVAVSQATTSTGERPIYLPIEPCRLADTRPAPNTVGPRATALGADETYAIDGWGAVGDCDLPTGSAGLSLNVTAVGATAQTNLRFFPADADVPTAANLNPSPGAPPTPNAVSVALDAAGQFSVFNKFGEVAIIVDVVGIYDDHDHDDRYYTKDEVDDAVSPEPVETVTDTVGGTGGGAYDLQCPDGSIAVGLRGRIATFETPGINYIFALCQEYDVGRIVSPLGDVTETDGTGPEGGGGAFELRCDPGSVMTGVSGTTRPIFGGAAVAVTDLTVHCADIGNGVTSSVGPVLGTGDTPFTLDCATGSHVVGLGPANADQLLDALALTCST